eukprot:scaffold153726_cov19-Prasinocladus_malaysianus.AAC.1
MQKWHGATGHCQHVCRTKHITQKDAIYYDITAGFLQVFLYRLVPGGMHNSFGVYCAQLAGMPHSIVKRSLEVLQHQK